MCEDEQEAAGARKRLPYKTLVMKAIEDLPDRKGTTRQAIKKYIQQMDEMAGESNDKMNRLTDAAIKRLLLDDNILEPSRGRFKPVKVKETTKKRPKPLLTTEEKKEAAAKKMLAKKKEKAPSTNKTKEPKADKKKASEKLPAKDQIRVKKQPKSQKLAKVALAANPRKIAPSTGTSADESESDVEDLPLSAALLPKAAPTDKGKPATKGRGRGARRGNRGGRGGGVTAGNETAEKDSDEAVSKRGTQSKKRGRGGKQSEPHTTKENDGDVSKAPGKTAKRGKVARLAMENNSDNEDDPNPDQKSENSNTDTEDELPTKRKAVGPRPKGKKAASRSKVETDDTNLESGRRDETDEGDEGRGSGSEPEIPLALNKPPAFIDDASSEESVAEEVIPGTTASESASTSEADSPFIAKPPVSRGRGRGAKNKP